MKNNINIRIFESLKSWVWNSGWLITLGICDLSFLQGIVALFIWPYYIGLHIS